MATSDPTEVGSIRGMARRANPAFAAGAVAVPVVAFAAALAWGDFRALTYVHVMTGVLWTGIDLFMGLVLGPVLGGLAVEERANVFRRFTPKMTFLMPVLAMVTIAAGIVLSLRLGYFRNLDSWLALTGTAITLPAVGLIAVQFDRLGDRRWQAGLGVLVVAHAACLAVTLPDFAMTAPAIVAALAIVTLLSVIGFGVILPGEVRWGLFV